MKQLDGGKIDGAGSEQVEDGYEAVKLMFQADFDKAAKLSGYPKVPQHVQDARDRLSNDPRRQMCRLYIPGQPVDKPTEDEILAQIDPEEYLEARLRAEKEAVDGAADLYLKVRDGHSFTTAERMMQDLLKIKFIGLDKRSIEFENSVRREVMTRDASEREVNEHTSATHNQVDGNAEGWWSERN
ncbi:MAG: hypothetical protein AAB373_04485 [Patescibacteria group bacterium]